MPLILVGHSQSFHALLVRHTCFCSLIPSALFYPIVGCIAVQAPTSSSCSASSFCIVIRIEKNPTSSSSSPVIFQCICSGFLKIIFGPQILFCLCAMLDDIIHSCYFIFWHCFVTHPLFWCRAMQQSILKLLFIRAVLCQISISCGSAVMMEKL